MNQPQTNNVKVLDKRDDDTNPFMWQQGSIGQGNLQITTTQECSI